MTETSVDILFRFCGSLARLRNAYKMICNVTMTFHSSKMSGNVRNLPTISEGSGEGDFSAEVS